ncbi:PREDICTED: barttin [Thamnophis sirtalis]|uniref:Barttin n=1 Tax=Thamnophis sirtalis TaxID=35019 RepID=A0A6I9YXC9_9SAUR|nr:PREDICTED: barttin [Thamnophis sirtalis]
MVEVTMAEEKTFRYGLIVLGFFLVMIGMFIMSVEKPQIYITFCTLGVLVIAVGIIWSMCQCYPKIRVVSIDSESEKFLIKNSESEKFLVKKLAASSSIENKIPEKKSLQTQYTSQKEADIYEKSLPTYEQIQTNSSAECVGTLPVPVPLVRTGRHLQPYVHAKAEVHRASESNGSPNRDATIGLNCPSKRFPKAAPLASLQEEVDTSSLDSTSNSPFLQRWKDAPNPVPLTGSQLQFKLPSYEDFALIDSLAVEGQGQSNENTVAPSQSHCSLPPTAGDGIVATAGHGRLECSSALQQAEEDDLYYGIQEDPTDTFPSVVAVAEPKP